MAADDRRGYMARADGIGIGRPYDWAGAVLPRTGTCHGPVQSGHRDIPQIDWERRADTLPEDGRCGRKDRA